jgi:trehalose 6-phosphate synthase
VPDPARSAHAGGLEVALSATLKSHECVWLGWSGKVAKKIDKVKTSTVERNGNTYITTDLVEEDFQEYYNGFANRVLWPILHYRLDLAEFSRRDLSGYMRVNNRFADQLQKVLKPDDIVWVHDYHLIPLARALRERGLQNRIGFFLHIPLPPPDVLTAMPNHEKLLPSLCDYDLVGFQTDGDSQNFARYLSTELRVIPPMIGAMAGTNRHMRIGTFPVGIETESFNRRARRMAQSEFAANVRKSVPGELMIGVDRLDYSKGLPLRLDAFERFLMSHPEWHNKVTYLQITPKSRSTIQEYADIERTVEAQAGRINSTYGDVAWMPVRYVNRTYGRTALGGLYRSARVGLVTPLRDGMNLVAKEYLAAQDENDPGVLILSRFAGAASELKAAVLVNPYDHEAVAVAIASAFAMSLTERQQRHSELWRALLANDISTWGDKFLAALTGEPLRRTGLSSPMLPEPGFSAKDLAAE